MAAKTHTATKMLSIFRQLEEKNANEPVPTGPKPLKRFTPPPEPTRPDEESDDEGVTSSEEEESETEQSTDVIRAVDKPTDEFLIQVGFTKRFTFRISCQILCLVLKLMNLF